MLSRRRGKGAGMTKNELRAKRKRQLIAMIDAIECFDAGSIQVFGEDSEGSFGAVYVRGQAALDLQAWLNDSDEAAPDTPESATQEIRASREWAKRFEDPPKAW